VLPCSRPPYPSPTVTLTPPAITVANIQSQVGYRVASRENKLTKPELGHLKKHSAPALRNLREFKVRAA